MLYSVLITSHNLSLELTLKKLIISISKIKNRLERVLDDKGLITVQLIKSVSSLIIALLLPTRRLKVGTLAIELCCFLLIENFQFLSEVLQSNTSFKFTLDPRGFRHYFVVIVVMELFSNFNVHTFYVEITKEFH